MTKKKRLTIRLDDELDGIIKHACRNGKCDKTTVVVNALRKGFGMGQSASVQAPETLQKEIVPGKIRYGDSYANIPNAEIKEIIEEDGTIHQIKDGKVVACKKPGKNWTVFIEV